MKFNESCGASAGILYVCVYICIIFKVIMAWFMMIQEGIAVGRTFANLKDYQVDGNKEMMAIGIMNIVGSCTSCYVTAG